MKEYELSVLFHPDLEMNLDPALEKTRKLIEANGGKIIKEDADGKKRLTYKIKGEEFAVYYFFDVQLPADAPKKINAVMTITDEILRAMLVKKDPRKEKYAARQKERVREGEEATDTNEEGE
ncbi:30S ribosomal protein S6 [Candidatus Saccharibacteria bacterium]|nr:30S ribosomal protein S6 [Candidatus Saccharibacteria bacterium]MBR3386400.1 30S ribosomal protein S6 [Candidatus Saccharibacteria bacterium]